MAAESTREKLFRNLHQELPYALTVETESWEDFKDDSARVQQVIYVGREQHKAICLGKGGKTIRLVRQAAQKEMETAFEIGRAHVGTPVTNTHLVCRLLLEKTKSQIHHNSR